jgi:hypothetical protein
MLPFHSDPTWRTESVFTAMHVPNGGSTESGVPLDLRVSVSLEASKRAEDNTKADL